jgi:hypothetical protein
MDQADQHTAQRTGGQSQQQKQRSQQHHDVFECISASLVYPLTQSQASTAASWRHSTQECVVEASHFSRHLPPRHCCRRVGHAQAMRRSRGLDRGYARSSNEHAVQFDATAFIVCSPKVSDIDRFTTPSSRADLLADFRREPDDNHQQAVKLGWCGTLLSEL